MGDSSCSATFGLRLFGDAAIVLPDGRPAPLERRAAALLALAALDPAVSRLRAADMLWPDSLDPRRNLRQQLLRFKQQFGRSILDGDKSLALPASVRLLVEEPGELLAGLSYDDCEVFAAWLATQRQRRLASVVDTLRQRLLTAETDGDLDDALRAALALMATDPTSEDHQREVMRIHYLRNDVAAGLATYQGLVSQLLRDHGAQPSAATEQLAKALRASAAPTRPRAARTMPATLLRPPRMVGRDRALQQIEDARAAGGVVLVLGEPGMGKSRLLAEAAPGALAVSARPGDSAVPFATLARLLHRLSERNMSLSGGAKASQVSLMSWPVSPETTGGGLALRRSNGDRLHLTEWTQGLLADAGQDRLVLDDLHFADDASLELLQTLVTADALRHVSWLMAQRPTAGSAACQTLRDHLIEAGLLRPVPLAPLDVNDVGELLVSLDLPGLEVGSWAPRLHRHTGGNPLFLLETLKQMQGSDVAQARLPASATVEALIEHRLRGLSPEALALARLAAVAGPDFGPALAEQVTGRSALMLADAWGELEAAQVLRDRAFAHDLVLDATQRGIPQPIAEHLHGAVARHLEAQSGAPARLAAHWMAARDERAAWPWLLKAADQARATLRRREEAEFLERAAGVAMHWPEHPGPSVVDVLLRAYVARECVDGVSPALALLDQALAHAQSAVDRTRVLAARAAGRTKLYELEGAVSDLRAALTQALAAGDDVVIMDIVSDLTGTLSMQGQHAEAIELIDRYWSLVANQIEPPGTWFSQRAMVLDNAGQPHDARPFHQQAMDIARHRGEHSETIICGLNMAIGYIDVGELAHADALLQDCERLRLTHEGMDGVNVVPWGLQALVHRDLGRYDRALEAGERMISAGQIQRPARLPMDRLQRAWTWFWIGQWARARQDVLPDVDYAQVPDWVLARALQLRDRLCRTRQLPAGDALVRAEAMLGPGSLRTMRDSVMLDAALVFGRAEQAEQILAAAEADGFHGVRWAAEWACARLALNAGDHARAHRHALACMERPAEQTPLDLAGGTWWHGLWAIWHTLGQTERAEAARAEGVAWLYRTQQSLAPPFHASFRDAVPAHRALLLSRVPED